MVKKAHQNPKGGLNKAGRAHFKKKGQNLKAPVKSGDNPRRASFLSRMAGVARKKAAAISKRNKAKKKK